MDARVRRQERPRAASANPGRRGPRAARSPVLARAQRRGGGHQDPSDRSPEGGGAASRPARPADRGRAHRPRPPLESWARVRPSRARRAEGPRGAARESETGRRRCIARAEGVPSEVLARLAEHPAWGCRQAVRRALLKNPRTPVHASMRLLKSLPRQELQKVRRDQEVPKVVRVAAERSLDGGHAEPPSRS